MPFTNIDAGPNDDGILYRCPCCRARTLRMRGGLECCPVCYWEDDGQDDHDADEVRGGPNSDLSLTAARSNYLACGASSPLYIQSVRPPTPAEQ